MFSITSPQARFAGRFPFASTLMQQAPQEDYSEDSHEKLALVVGVPASGKSTSSRSFSAHAHVIEFDQVLKLSNLAFFPHLKGKNFYTPALIDVVHEFIHQPEHIVAGVIDHLTNGKLQHPKPIIAEGIGLSYQGWENLLVDALRLLDRSISRTELFWLNPSPIELSNRFENRENMKRSIDRIEKATKSLRFRLKNRGGSSEFGTSTELIDAMAEFFGTERPELKI